MPQQPYVPAADIPVFWRAWGRFSVAESKQMTYAEHKNGEEAEAN